MTILQNETSQHNPVHNQLWLQQQSGVPQIFS